MLTMFLTLAFEISHRGFADMSVGRSLSAPDLNDVPQSGVWD